MPVHHPSSYHIHQASPAVNTMLMAFTASNVECVDVSKSSHPISTGIGFFDHMIDQLNSHAQIGVAVTVSKQTGDEHVANGNGASASSSNLINRYAGDDQREIVSIVGAAIGKELRKIVHTSNNGTCSSKSSRFCCPLDEALVECIITKQPNASNEEGQLTKFALPPYGKYPANKGRSKIGQLQTSCIESFFVALAKHSGLNISLIKIRGDNGHHVVESAFKAFSRALRNLIDGTDTNDYTSDAFEQMWGVKSESHAAGLALGREGKLERCTKETSILVHALLDEGENGSVKVDTGIKTMDDFVSVLAKEACISMEVKCKGDLYVDDHHTSEDVAIAIGQVMNTALGTKAGLNRMWCAVGT